MVISASGNWKLWWLWMTSGLPSIPHYSHCLLSNIFTITKKICKLEKFLTPWGHICVFHSITQLLSPCLHPSQGLRVLRISSYSFQNPGSVAFVSGFCGHLSEKKTIGGCWPKDLPSLCALQTCALWGPVFHSHSCCWLMFFCRLYLKDLMWPKCKAISWCTDVVNSPNSLIQKWLMPAWNSKPTLKIF